jgi:hypothetical protein
MKRWLSGARSALNGVTTGASTPRMCWVIVPHFFLLNSPSTFLSLPNSSFISKLLDLMKTQESLQTLLAEEQVFSFRNENLPVRVLFAKHLRFAEDRIARPEFFCWPAMHFVGTTSFSFSLTDSLSLLKRHGPLFVADFENEIRPSIQPGKPAEAVQQTFNDFYRWNLLYNVVRQWIIEDGPLNYDYTWLTPQYSAPTIKPWVDSLFAEVFHFQPDQFVLFGKT